MTKYYKGCGGAIALLTSRAEDDTSTTIQGQPTIIDILANDRDDDGTIQVTTVQIQLETNINIIEGTETTIDAIA